MRDGQNVSAASAPWVCFECLTTTAGATAAGLRPPAPHAFAVYFLRAAAVLESYGVAAVHSTAVLDSRRVSFCPVGHDALIVSPDGRVASCYLLAEDWERAGLDMHLGRVDPGGGLQIDAAAVQRLRDTFQVDNRPRCADCFCRFHCGGGCHVHHDTNGGALAADPVCVQTRLITVGLMVRGLGHEAHLQRWLADDAGRAAVAARVNDRLRQAEV